MDRLKQSLVLLSRKLICAILSYCFAFYRLEGDAVPGHVGAPSPCNAIKLIDVPELGYFAKDNAGEVCLRGTNIFKGYYKNEAETRSVLDEDGWLHTGDIGKWTERGTLKIVDRKKYIFKLAQVCCSTRDLYGLHLGRVHCTREDRKRLHLLKLCNADFRSR